MIQNNSSYNILAYTNKALVKVFGQYVKNYRLNQNITQEKLAQLCGIKRITLSRLENGTNFNIMIFLEALRHLGILETTIKHFIVKPQIDPFLIMKMKGKTRKNASKDSTKNQTP